MELIMNIPITIKEPETFCVNCDVYNGYKKNNTHEGFSIPPFCALVRIEGNWCGEYESPEAKKTNFLSSMWESILHIRKKIVR